MLVVGNNKTQYYRRKSGEFNIDDYTENSSGCVLHLKADTGVTIDASGTPAGEGDAIRKWQSQTSNGEFAFQNLLSARPIYHTNALNGLPMVSFTKENFHSMYTQRVTDFNIYTPSIFCVSRWNSGTGSNSAFIFGKGGNSAQDQHAHTGGNNHGWYKLCFNIYDSTNIRWCQGANGNGTSNNGERLEVPTLADWNIFSFIVKHNALTVINVNGVDNSYTNVNDNHTHNDKPFMLGQGFLSGWGWTSCDIAELIVLNYSVPDWLKRQIINYLSNKWGISVTNTVPDDLPARTAYVQRSAI